ncbi:MAG: hypothetical protein KatS3mg003_1467 [Candidatus Nitrosocaldaceae archaeon]|nr:MAG: hypothetical protein KatS3mg003_1467 [Candidatus Nitrosocaldaceae archaeon]
MHKAILAGITALIIITAATINIYAEQGKEFKNAGKELILIPIGESIEIKMIPPINEGEVLESMQFATITLADNSDINAYIVTVVKDEKDRVVTSKTFINAENGEIIQPKEIMRVKPVLYCPYGYIDIDPSPKVRLVCKSSPISD